MRRQRWVGRASGLAMTHGHRDFTVCSCSLLPVLFGGGPRSLMCSTTADTSGAPAIRSARTNARRRIASCAHFGMGCSHAPRPGRLPAGSTVTAHLPFPVDTATTRSSSTANSRFRQPTHVRTGPRMRRCAVFSAAEVSRWITADFTLRFNLTQPVVSTAPGSRPNSLGRARGMSANDTGPCLMLNKISLCWPGLRGWWLWLSPRFN
jgi:hypothetical protein